MSDFDVDRPKKQGFSKHRISGLQDGIFAVALTLLALDLRIPEGLSVAAVHERLLGLMPAIGVYATTFAIIAVIWLYVYSFQEIVPKQDIPAASLLLLACSFIVLLPFTSSTYARYFWEPLTVFAFASNVTLLVVVYAFYVEYASRKLIPRTVDQRFLRTVKYLLWLEVASGVASTVFCFWPLVTLLWLIFGVAAAYVSLVILHERFATAAVIAQTGASVMHRTVRGSPTPTSRDEVPDLLAGDKPTERPRETLWDR
jgi:uncharacterized membrane protein